VQQDGPIDVTLPCSVRITGARNAGPGGIVDFDAELSEDSTNWRRVNALTRIQLDSRLMVAVYCPNG
jgi:hypothetical protein